MSYLLYFNESGTPNFDGSNPDYSFFTTKLINDSDYETIVNPSINELRSKPMVMIPTSDLLNTTIEIGAIDIAGLDTSHSLIAGDFLIRIYQGTGLAPTALSTSNFQEDVFVTRFISNDVIYDGDIFKTTLTPSNNINFSFNPNHTIRNKYFIICISITRPISTLIKLFKSRSLSCSYKNSANTISCAPIISDSMTTNSFANYATNETNSAYTYLPGSGNTMGLFAMNFRSPESPICFHGLSLVHTNNGIIYAKDVKKNDKLISDGKEIEIKTILKTSGCNNFIKIKKDSIDTNKPYVDLYITRTHMIKINDKELQAQELLDRKGVSLINSTKYYDVYSFITKNGNYVNINGLNVKTFNSNELINY